MVDREKNARLLLPCPFAQPVSPLPVDHKRRETGRCGHFKSRSDCSVGDGLSFLRTIVAKQRQVLKIGATTVFNIFLGWALMGWVAAPA